MSFKGGSPMLAINGLKMLDMTQTCHILILYPGLPTRLLLNDDFITMSASRSLRPIRTCSYIAVANSGFCIRSPARMKASGEWMASQLDPFLLCVKRVYGAGHQQSKYFRRVLKLEMQTDYICSKLNAGNTTVDERTPR